MQKFIRSIAISAAILFASVLPSKAQDSRAYVLLNGGTNKVTALASNQPIYLNVSEYQSVDFQASVAGTGTSNLLFNVFRSLDTIDYETTVFTQLVAPSASTTNVAYFSLTVSNAASLKIVPANTNSGGFVTNVTLKARFKAPKIKPTTQ